MNKKVVVFGGGTGMSILLKGLKNFPVSITAIVSVCDDGSSTGRLREEFNIPAVGDIRKILVALSSTEPLVETLLNYRFKTSSDLNGHTVGNLLLTATKNITGNISSGVEALSNVLNLKGKVLPLTEDNVVLMAEMKDGSFIEGEHFITESNKRIKKIFYKDEPVINEVTVQAIKEADLLVFSMGSLYTSLLPNLLPKEIIMALDNSKALIVYTCNLVTQPGETCGFKVSDHIKIINSYLGSRKIDVVLANNVKIKEDIARQYSSLEQKDPVMLDISAIKKLNVKLIQDNFVIIENDLIRHDALKVGFHLFSMLLNQNKKNLLN